MFLDGPAAKARDAVRVLFAGERVRPDDLLPVPDVGESVSSDRFQVITLEALVRMKLASFRRKIKSIYLICSTWGSSIGHGSIRCPANWPHDFKTCSTSRIDCWPRQLERLAADHSWS